MGRDAGPLAGSLLDEACGEVAAEAGEAPAGEGADEDADQDVTEVVFAYEDAADCHHECPEVHPPAVCLEPFRHAAGCRLAVWLWVSLIARWFHEASFHSDECAECQSEGVGGMCGEETVSSATFKDV